MKKRLMAVAVVVAVCMVLSMVSNVMAEDANQPKETPKETPKEKAKDKNLVIGILSVVKDNDGNIAGITIIAHKDLKYKVVLDEKSKEMAKSFADKRVRVEGAVETKGGVKWLTVETFSELKPKADVKPRAKPAPKPGQ